jgi:hypothetical protein
MTDSGSYSSPKSVENNLAPLSPFDYAQVTGRGEQDFLNSIRIAILTTKQDWDNI